MRRISNASIYHGFRGQLPNELPSDELQRSLIINRLHGLSPTASDGSTFEQYLARKKRSDPPKTKKNVLLTAENHHPRSTTIDNRSQAFLQSLGVDPLDIVSTSKPSHISTECARARSFAYNPDRDTTLLPPSDVDAFIYHVLTPKVIKEASYYEIQHDGCTVDYVESDLRTALPMAFSDIASKYECVQELYEPQLSVASCEPPVKTHTAVTVSNDDEGYESSHSVSSLRERGPDTTQICVQLKVWYTGRVRRHCRKAQIRQFVKLRRRIHRRRGVHCLNVQKYPRDSAVVSSSYAKD